MADIPKKYLVNLNNVALGNKVSNIRNSSNYINKSVDVNNIIEFEKYGIKFLTKQNKIDMLNNLGFIWKKNHKKDMEWSKTLKALIFYKKIKGNLIIQQGGKKSCVINNIYFTEEELNKLDNIEPLNIKKEDLNDFPLGRRVNAIKSKKQYIKDNDERYKILQDIGFPFHKL